MPDPASPAEAPEPLPATWRERLELLGGGVPLSPSRLAAGVAVAAFAAVLALLVLRGPPPPAEVSLPLAGGPGDPAATSTTTTTLPADVMVHAAGAVHSPGVYRLRAGARVADLVELAGGPLDDSDLDSLNLAAAVADGERVYVPRVGEAVPKPPAAGGGAGAQSEDAGGVVDVNTATAEQLDTLPGVGPATAKAILDERDRRGRFDSVEDLLNVRGIGEAKLEALRDLVRV
ncbi:MAG: helix-hairpin-helix domain-containing protein [Acidimicrobiales bacterium]